MEDGCFSFPVIYSEIFSFEGHIMRVTEVYKGYELCQGLYFTQIMHLCIFLDINQVRKHFPFSED